MNDIVEAIFMVCVQEFVEGEWGEKINKQQVRQVNQYNRDNKISEWREKGMETQIVTVCYTL